LFNMILKLQPITQDELEKRVTGPLQEWLNELKRTNRIKFIGLPLNGWICTEDYEKFFGHESNSQKMLLLHYFQSRGSVSKNQINSVLHHIPMQRIEKYLSELLTERKIIKGQLITNSPEEYWCDLYNFQELYRRAIVLRRTVQNPADFSLFNRFLFKWHGIDYTKTSLENILDRYNGYSFPLYFIEREILSTRNLGAADENRDQDYDHFCELISNGEVNIKFSRKSKDGIRYLEFYKYGQGNLFELGKALTDEINGLSHKEIELFDFLKNNGASRVKEMELALGWSTNETSEMLKKLVENGMISSDQYENLVSLITRESTSAFNGKKGFQNTTITESWMRAGRSRRPSRSDLRKKVMESSRLKDGRWYLLNSLTFLGKDVDFKTKAEFQARLLLNRYGILVKEWYRRENGFLPWYDIFQVLKRLEWQGEIRRGYFVSGLSGVQFALPEALELLERVQKESERKESYVMLSTLDPALPLGGLFKNNTFKADNSEIQISRGISNHLVFSNGKYVVYSELYAKRLWFVDEPNEQLFKYFISSLKNWLALPRQYRPKQKIEIELINNMNASTSEFAEPFITNGFEVDDQMLVLWPTNI
jgi:ATP-dependent Lhr-like helicase